MRYILTIGGQGTRLKSISPVDKHLLYWRDKRIVEWIQSIIPTIEIIGTTKTPDRRETLKEISHYENTCIIDCDIIPFGLDSVEFDGDTICVFTSNKEKYGSVVIENGKVNGVAENVNISRFKCSGAYYVENVSDLINKMKNPNSIGAAMTGASVLLEKSFVRMGDIEDYFESL